MNRGPFTTVAITCALAAALWIRQPELAAGAAEDFKHTLVRIAPADSTEVRQWDAFLNRHTGDGTLRIRAAYPDPVAPERVVESFVQYHREIEVLGGDVSRIRDGQTTVSVSGRVYADIDVDTSPRFDARAAALYIEGRSGSPVLPGRVPDLVILPTLDGGFALAYRGTTQSARTHFVDAHNGDSLMEWDEIRHEAAVGAGRGVLGDRKKVSATRRTGTYLAWDALRPAQILTLDTRNRDQDFLRLRGGGRVLESDLADDADNDWTHAAAVDTHAHTGWVYDYFFKRHRHSGVDGRNTPIVSVVNSSRLLPSNAFFTPPPFGPEGLGGFFYGATTRGTPLTPLDIVGHEVMHGVTNAVVTRRTGTGLGASFLLERGPGGCALPFWCDGDRFVLTSNDAGAMNEGLSDAFATAIEFFMHPAGSGTLRADYLVGEDLPEPILQRSLANPVDYEIRPGIRYPDHMGNRVLFPVVFVSNGPFRCGVFRCDLFPTAFVAGRRIDIAPYVPGRGLQQTDAGGVHMNLTVISHAFYLAIEGGRNRTSGRTVQGVGPLNREQVERVFFLAVRDLLPRNASFEDLAVSLRQSARVNYGSGSAVTRAIDDALAAVGL